MIVGHIGGAASSFYNWLISKSIRLRSTANAYLTRTPSVAGSKTQMTFSFWVKPSLASNKCLFATALSGSQIEAIGFDNGFGHGSERLHVVSAQGTVNVSVMPSRRFRDPSAWYHIVVVIDTPNATAADRVRIYTNGVRETAFDIASYPSQNYQFQYWNNTYSNTIGQLGPYYGSFQFDGCLSEIHFIDGQALTAESFGEFESTSSVWIPKRYTGTYGTNGFYLDFKDGSTLSSLCSDKSGNGHNWTANNISLTSGVTYDWMDDTPTNNFATLNVLANKNVVPTNGALSFPSVGQSGKIVSTMAVPRSVGKWYWEVTLTTSASACVGISGTPITTVDNLGMDTGECAWLEYYGQIRRQNTTIQTGLPAASNGDVFGVAIDSVNQTMQLYKNNSAFGTTTDISSLSEWHPAVGTLFIGATGHINFGQRPFAYSPPAGFKALCTKNLPTPSITNPKRHFDVKTYVGDGAASGRNISCEMSPDLGWIKSRSIATGNHFLFDTPRTGPTKVLGSNQTIAEYSNSDLALGTNQFTVGDNGGSDDYNPNKNLSTYVAWLWKAGGAPVTNNAGLIQSQVSANPQAGFSIVTYTGTGANATVGHGLGVAPKMVIVKRRNGTASQWAVYHASIGAANALYLNLTNAQAAAIAMWNSAAPTSSAVSIGTDATVNGNADTYVAYCFAEIPGYSKIGSYTGNGSADGPFVYCGFRPRFIMVKSIDNAYAWAIYDTQRNTFNAGQYSLYPNLSNAEGSGEFIDVTANGFKVRYTGNTHNTNGNRYMFYAIAEMPFNYANAR